MPLSQKQRVVNLMSSVAPCWAGEALVARRYFGGGHRTPARDVRWIGFQIFKEHSGGGVYGGPGATVISILRSASERAAAITLATPADEFSAILGDLEFAVDELRHMTQFMGLYACAGGDTTASIESLGEIGNARKLASLRHKFRATDLGRNAVDLSEGGGLGLQFGLKEHFSENPPADSLDCEIEKLSRAVLADESSHLGMRFKAALGLGNSTDTWTSLAGMLHEICAQKLRERNEQFSSPLTEREISDIVCDRALGATYIDRHLGFVLAGL